MPGFPQPTLFLVSVAVLLIGILGLFLPRCRTRRPALLASIVAAIACMLLFRTSLLSLQQLATSLVMPASLIWLALIAAIAYCMWRGDRVLAACLGLVWLLLTLGGNVLVSRSLIAYVERDYRSINPLEVVNPDKPLDAIVALGGATMPTPSGGVQVSAAGDRVVLAARLYHQGAARLLVSTGEVDQAVDHSGRRQAQETAAIWHDLAVPKEQVLTIGGRNTREEMQHIAAAARQHGWQRIGLVTSAFHLSRAQRLGRDFGLEFEPLPAHFQGVIHSIHPIQINPSSRSLNETAMVFKEMLARLVGR